MADRMKANVPEGEQMNVKENKWTEEEKFKPKETRIGTLY